MAVDKTYLSKQMKKRRVDKEWSQNDLSKASGVSTAAITNRERKISSLYKCAVDQLAGLANDPAPVNQMKKAV